MPVHAKNADTELVFENRHLEVGSRGGYCLVRRRPRDTAPMPDPPALPEPAALPEVVRDFEEDIRTVELPRPVPALPEVPDEPVRAARAEYHDPQLCSCDRMLRALSEKVVTVIVAGPVTLPPALLTEEAFLSGRFKVDRLDQAYDGKLWAFRYCPFEDEPTRLIDDQVPMPAMLDDGLFCCVTMRQAVEHDRVDLPPAEKHAHGSPMFVSPGKAGTIFRTCPWCATTAFDLGMARFKRHLASRPT